jgi:asparagine synthetase B (glutamine-hydrolysing)
MFTPTAADVRRFFCGVYAKSLSAQPMEALEQLASEWIQRHPHYHERLADTDRALQALAEDPPVADADNPFLHLSMHLSISEQCSIDQPPGIRQAVELLAARRDSVHEAHHEVMECLGEMLWNSQRHGRPPDGQAYIDAVRRRATRD